MKLAIADPEELKRMTQAIEAEFESESRSRSALNWDIRLPQNQQYAAAPSPIDADSENLIIDGFLNPAESAAWRAHSRRAAGPPQATSNFNPMLPLSSRSGDKNAADQRSRERIEQNKQI